MASDLDRYVGSLEYLPHEVQKNLEKLRDLDSKMQVVMKHTDRLIDEYLKCDFPSKDKKTERMMYIDSLYGKAKRYSDSKVKLSYETYEMVDKNIKRLDLYLSRFQSEIEERALIIAQAPDHHSETRHRPSHRPEHKHDREKKTKSDKKPSSGSQHHANGNGTGTTGGNKQSSHGGSSFAGERVTSNGHQQSTTGDKSKDSDKRKKPSVSGSSDEDRAKTKKKPRRKSRSPSPGSRSEVRPSVIPEDIYDMPVDPNEPIYCVCRQVSYGDMVACDDQECSIEWFHFSCVGLTATPKGKWYCKECTENRRKKK